MGLFDHFPYTNVHELNLNWVLSMMKALEAEWEAFTAGNSLTFADPMLHDVTKTYSKNTIVLDSNGDAYVSLQAVPVGVELQNEDYWLMVFDYEAFIEKVNKNFTARYYRGSYRATAAMVIGDWLTVDDVLCKATAAIAYDDILEVGVNIEHFTLEDFIKAFMQSANQLIQQYKNDIDASELAYRQQLAQDIATTTANLQAQLDLAISGATVDSEVINARIGADGVTYPTLGDAIRTQIDDINDLNGLCKPIPASDWAEGYRTGAETTLPAPTTNVYWRTAIINCSPGDKFVLNTDTDNWSAYRPWVFYDSSDQRLTLGAAAGVLVNEIIEAPQNAAKLVLNDYDANSTWSKICYKNMSILDRVKNLENDANIFRGAVTASDYSNSLANITDVGIYYISSVQVFNDVPVLVYGNAAASMTVTLYAATLALQEYINASGENFTRLVDISTNTPITSGGLPCDVNGWFRKSDFKYSMFRGPLIAADHSNLLANVTDCGTYYISSVQVFNDAPVLVYGNAAASMTVTLYAATLALQEYINASGENFTRLVDISTNTPITSGGLPCDVNGWFRKSDFKYSMFRGSLIAADHSNLLSNVIEYGAYYIGSTQAFNDRPTDLETGIGAVIFVIPFASSLTLQTYFDAKGCHRTRIITNSTKTPYTTGLNVDANGWFKTMFTRWQNKRIVFFGDSRTWYDGQNYTSNCKPDLIGTPCIGYQEQVRSLLDVSTLNEGISGGTSIDVCTRIRNYNFTDIDAVFLEGGVNDFIISPAPSVGSLAPIGSTFDTSTIYGAWQSAIEYIMTNYPEVKIFIDIPAIAWKNTNDVYPYETAKIKQDVAELYNLPILDLYKTAGINIINRDTFFADDVGNTGWYLHFNNFGNLVLGQIIAEYIDTH